MARTLLTMSRNTFMLLVPRASESETAPAKDSSKKETEEGDKRKPPNPTAYRNISLGKKRMPSPEAALKAGQEPGGIGGRHSEAIWALLLTLARTSARSLRGWVKSITQPRLEETELSQPHDLLDEVTTHSVSRRPIHLRLARCDSHIISHTRAAKTLVRYRKN